MTMTREPVTETPEVRRLPDARIAWGVGLIALGALWFADRAGWLTVDFGVILPVAVLLVGALMLFRVRSGPQPGLIAVGLVLALLALLTAFSPFAGFRGGIGERTHTPHGVAQVDSPYRLGIGEMTLDLRGLEVSGEVDIEGVVSLGKLVVLVPATAEFSVDASSTMGKVTVLDRISDGVGPNETFRTAGFGQADDRLVIDAQVLFGEVEVRR